MRLPHTLYLCLDFWVPLWYTVSTSTNEDTMLRKRLITLLIETDEGRPEDWDWPSLIDASPLTTIAVVNVEEV